MTDLHSPSESHADRIPQQTSSSGWRDGVRFFRRHWLGTLITGAALVWKVNTEVRGDNWHREQLAQIVSQNSGLKNEGDVLERSYEHRSSQDGREEFESRAATVLRHIRTEQKRAAVTFFTEQPLERMLWQDQMGFFNDLRSVIDTASDYSHWPELRDRRMFEPGAEYIPNAVLALWCREFFDSHLLDLHMPSHQLAELAEKYEFLQGQLLNDPRAGSLYLHRLIRAGQRDNTVNERLRLLFTRVPLRRCSDCSLDDSLFPSALRLWIAALPAAEKAIALRILRDCNI